jgi:hypothetical protein
MLAVVVVHLDMVFLLEQMVVWVIPILEKQQPLILAVVVVVEEVVLRLVVVAVLE